jgi:hypothetical protein
MVVPIARKRMYLSRAVDHEGEILEHIGALRQPDCGPGNNQQVPTKAHLPAV